MKVNKDYLYEFCNHHNVFDSKEISEENLNKLNYNFGVPKVRLYNIHNLEDLERTINKHSRIPIEADQDVNHEAFVAYRKFLIQNSKINSNPNFIRRYFPGMFCF